MPDGGVETLVELGDSNGSRKAESRWAAKPRPHSEFDSATVGGRAPVTHDGGLRHIEHTHTHSLAHPHAHTMQGRFPGRRA